MFEWLVQQMMQSALGDPGLEALASGLGLQEEHGVFTGEVAGASITLTREADRVVLQMRMTETGLEIRKGIVPVVTGDAAFDSVATASVLSVHRHLLHVGVRDAWRSLLALGVPRLQGGCLYVVFEDGPRVHEVEAAAHAAFALEQALRKPASLEGIITSDPVPGARAEALWSLYQDNPLKAGVIAARRHDDPDLQMQLVAALADPSDERLLPLIARASTDEMRVLLCEALSEEGLPTAVKALLNGTRSSKVLGAVVARRRPSPHVSRVIVEALGRGLWQKADTARVVDLLVPVGWALCAAPVEEARVWMVRLLALPDRPTQLHLLDVLGKTATVAEVERIRTEAGKVGWGDAALAREFAVCIARIQERAQGELGAVSLADETGGEVSVVQER